MRALHPERRYVAAPRAVQLRPARQAGLPRAAGPRHVPPADGRAVRRRQRLSADPRRAAPAGHDRRPALARGRARSSGSASTRRPPLAEPERTFLHRYYDYVVVPAEGTRAPVRRRRCGRRSSACCALGAPRTDFFFDDDGDGRRRASGSSPPTRSWPAGRSCCTRRRSAGGGAASTRRAGLDAARLRAALPADHVLVLKTHPNLDPAATPTSGLRRGRDPPASR